MKSLIVEDDISKQSSLDSFFKELGWHTKIVGCAADCMDELEVEYYDILVIDICIPWDSDDPQDSPDPSHSNVVIKEIRRGSNKCPGFVVGITQDDTIFEQVKDIYERFGWHCLRYEKGQRWEDLLSERIRIANNQNRRLDKKLDSAVTSTDAIENNPENCLHSNTEKSNDCDASKALIMKGGGAKGLAYVGALRELEPVYKFNWFVGTSAGAITAVLLAAGFTSEELEKILKEKNFKEFLDSSTLGACVNLFIHKGLYRADTLTIWLDHLLARKLGRAERIRASDLPNRLTILASQSGKRVVIFDSKENPDFFPAYAARCSMAIPYVFTPQTIDGVRAFDGGLQNNFPVEEALRLCPDLDFVAFYLGDEIYIPRKERSIFRDLISIFMDAGDNEVIRRHNEKIVLIDPYPIKTLHFKLSVDEKDFLLAAGRLGAVRFLKLDSEPTCLIERDRLRNLISRQSRRRCGWLFTLLSLILIVFLVSYYLL